MKATEIINKLCDAWEKGVPKRLQEAQKKHAKASKTHDALHADDTPKEVAQVKGDLAKARAELTQAQGAQGRIQWLREALRNMVDQAGDVEVKL